MGLVSSLIGVEAVQEAKGEERCSASCARMREEVEAPLYGQ